MRGSGWQPPSAYVQTHLSLIPKQQGCEVTSGRNPTVNRKEPHRELEGRGWFGEFAHGTLVVGWYLQPWKDYAFIKLYPAALASGDIVNL